MRGMGDPQGPTKDVSCGIRGIADRRTPPERVHAACGVPENETIAQEEENNGRWG